MSTAALDLLAHDGPGFIRIDTCPDHLRVTGEGWWRPEQVDEHFAALDRAARAMRSERGRARILVDLRGSAVQPTDTTARVDYWTRRIYQRTDRLAMLVSSSLLKAQLRRLTVAAQRELFLSESAARTWLMA